MIDLTPVIQALTGLFAATLTAVVIPLVRSRLCAERLERARDWARIIVTAAEKLFPQPGSGREKKVYVLDFLSRLNLSLSGDELKVLVECAVCELTAKGERLCRS
ncbi:MAG: phage holin family protein [Oscillospiraceae bacterium]|nr:phage holin family protein [Oscillospiraceae bacterium]